MSDDQKTLRMASTSRKLIGRSKETKILLDAMARIRESDGKAEAVMISGYSGTGKSFLVTTVVKEHREDFDLLYASGKYGQNEGAVSPFSAVTDAMGELCHEIKRSVRATFIVEQVQRSFNMNELQAMSTVVPSISSLVPFSVRSEVAKELTLGDAAVVRFMRLLRRFLGVIATSEAPVVLFLDDLQWIDDASRKLVTSIFSEGRLQNFLFIGAIRDGEDSSFEVPTSSVIPSVKIVCDNLGLDGVMLQVSVLTGWQKEDCEQLGRVIYNRTAGNPFFLKKFMEEIFSKSLLSYDDEHQKYLCDPDAVAGAMPPVTNVVDLMVAKIGSLSHSTQLLLVIAAALGYTFHWDVLEPIMGSIELVSLFPSSLISSSDEASLRSREGLMMTISHDVVIDAISESCQAALIEPTKVQGQYRFCHDRVQQSALSLLPRGRRGERIKAALGSVMLELSRSNPTGSWMFYAATNLLVKYKKESSMSVEEVARLCLEASLTASSQAAIRSGAKYADSGIKLLDKNGWTDHYKLCLDLFGQSMKLHFANGNIKSSKKRVKIILKKALCPEDKIGAYFVSLSILNAEERFDSCVEEGVGMVRSLGVKAPEKVSLPRVLWDLFKAKRQFRGMTVDDVLSLPTTTDKKIEVAIVLLGIIAAAAFDSGDEIRMLSVCVQMFQLTLEHGLTENASAAVAGFGVLLAFQGNLKQAFECGQAAAILGRKFEGGYAFASAPIYFVCWHLKRPLKECVTGLIEAAEAGIKYGDAFHATYAIRGHGALGLFVTRSLMTYERYVISTSTPRKGTDHFNLPEI